MQKQYKQIYSKVTSLQNIPHLLHDYMTFIKKLLTQEEIIMRGLLASSVVPVQMRYVTSRSIRRRKKQEKTPECVLT